MKLKDNRKRLIGVMEISRRTQISAAHVSKILSGKRTPSLEAFVLIANALRISLDDLYMQLSELQEQQEAEKNRLRMVV